MGPDFIDPGHHTAVSGQISCNVDSWMLSKAYNRNLFHKYAKDADIAVVEGVMGLFDGYDGRSESGSTAQMAKWLDLPVVLVISAKGKARSAAAIVKGFETFDPQLNLAGVIFSKTGSARHYEYLKTAVEENCTTPCIGFMPRDERISMPERHLGLVTAQEKSVNPQVLDILTSHIEKHIQMDKLLETLPPHPLYFNEIKIPAEKNTEKDQPVIAVAKDKAFCFYYPDNLELLEKAGAKLVEFSPLIDRDLPDNIDGIYFGGGYPEVHAEQLSENRNMLEQVRKASRNGMPIYGECGGFMFLCQSVQNTEGKTFPMTGCFDFKISMSDQLRSLGYREIILNRDTIIGPEGARIRGHEFHYSSILQGHEETCDVYSAASRAGQNITLNGYLTDQTLGSYFHVHFGSNQECAKNFVNACKRYCQEKQ